MLSSDERVADTSSGARGCTFESKGFEIDILGQPATLWDTAGLDEGDAGRVPKSEAIVQLYRLVRNLEDGVSLLMFVMRAPRIKSSAPQNWKLFHEIICQWKVPIVIAITGLEQEDNMDKWWWDNKGTFQSYGITPSGFACITASRGRPRRRGEGHVFDDEFEESRDKVRALIRSTALVNPWHVPAAQWFKTIVETTIEYKSKCFRVREIRHDHLREVDGEAVTKLIHVCGMSESDAKELAGKMKGW